MAEDLTSLPAGLPVPEDDGAAAHLPGLAVPALTLSTSDGGHVDLGALGEGRTVLYLYPLTGRPGVALPDGWDAIPGARGCTAQACDVRDHLADLLRAGVDRVYGLSSQGTEHQAEAADRLHLSFPLVSDPDLALADALRLPVFTVPGHGRLFRRLTLVIREGRIEHVFYPVFPPDTHARQVLDWLAAHPVPTPAEALRARLRADLTAAMKARRTAAVAPLRSLLAAVDNAEAVEVTAAPSTSGEHVAGAGVGVGSTEVRRRTLSAADLRALVEAEVADRVAAAAEYAAHGRADAAATVRAEADLLRTYREGW